MTIKHSILALAACAVLAAGTAQAQEISATPATEASESEAGRIDGNDMPQARRYIDVIYRKNQDQRDRFLRKDNLYRERVLRAATLRQDIVLGMFLLRGTDAMESPTCDALGDQQHVLLTKAKGIYFDAIENQAMFGGIAGPGGWEKANDYILAARALAFQCNAEDAELRMKTGIQYLPIDRMF